MMAGSEKVLNMQHAKRLRQTIALCRKMTQAMTAKTASAAMPMSDCTCFSVSTGTAPSMLPETAVRGVPASLTPVEAALSAVLSVFSSVWIADTAGGEPEEERTYASLAALAPLLIAVSLRGRMGCGVSVTSGWRARAVMQRGRTRA